MISILPIVNAIARGFGYVPANQNFHTPEPGPSLIEMYEERCLQAVLALLRQRKPDENDPRYNGELIDKADPSVGIMEDHYEIDYERFQADLEAYGKLRGEAETWCGSVAIMRNPYYIDKGAVAKEMRDKAQQMLDEVHAAKAAAEDAAWSNDATVG